MTSTTNMYTHITAALFLELTRSSQSCVCCGPLYRLALNQVNWTGL